MITKLDKKFDTQLVPSNCKNINTKLRKVNYNELFQLADKLYIIQIRKIIYYFYLKFYSLVT